MYFSQQINPSFFIFGLFLLIVIHLTAVVTNGECTEYLMSHERETLTPAHALTDVRKTEQH